MNIKNNSSTFEHGPITEVGIGEIPVILRAPKYGEL
jgi:hypothetical protein